MAEKRQSIGFGFVPEETQHHFLVILPRNNSDSVIVYERFEWDNDLHGKKLNQKIDLKNDRAKVRFAKHKWDGIADSLKDDFNRRLLQKKYPSGQWKVGQNPVQRLLGKELVLLAWAIEDCDPSVIPTALKNWNGLREEERWWLFTMANASTGSLDDKRGWRKALRYALTENPIMDINYKSDLFSHLINEKLEEYEP